MIIFHVDTGCGSGLRNSADSRRCLRVVKRLLSTQEEEAAVCWKNDIVMMPRTRPGWLYAWVTVV